MENESKDGEREFSYKETFREIPNILPFDGEDIPVEEIIDSFLADNESVSRYESAKRWENKIGRKPFEFFGLSYIGLILFTYMWENHLSSGTALFWTTATLLIVLPLGLSASLFVAKKIFKSQAGREDISHHKAVYHRLALGTRYYQQNKIDRANKELKSAGELLEFESHNPFDPRSSFCLRKYLGKVREEDSTDYISQTYPFVADRVLRNLLYIEKSNLDKLVKSSESNASVKNYGAKELIKSYFKGWSENKFLSIIAPYALAAPFLYLVYTVNTAAAQILAVIVVGLVQTHYNPSQEDS